MRIKEMVVSFDAGPKNERNFASALRSLALMPAQSGSKVSPVWLPCLL